MNRRRFLSTLVLLGYLSSGFLITRIQPAIAQTSPGLYYTFYGQKIALTEQTNEIAVNFKKVSGRGQPLYLQLETDLATGTSSSGQSGRGEGTPQAKRSDLEVKPLGGQFAIVKLRSEAQRDEITQRIQQQGYVESTLPVLYRPAQAEESRGTIVLPNEILVSFAPDLPQQQVTNILEQQNLEVVRKLRFTNNRYVVKAKNASGTAVLNVANRLNAVAGIQSATPNFIQSLQREMQPSLQQFRSPPTESISPSLLNLPKLEGLPYSSPLLSLQWHLNSTPRRGTSLPRTDVRATEAWKESRRGDRVVVAVIDSMIQWDHPDLKNNLYTLPPNTPDALPGETHGWNFVNDDADTRVSSKDLAQLQPILRSSFQKTDAELLALYPALIRQVQRSNPKLTRADIARILRNEMQSYVTNQFHGTWSAGVIAAQPNNNQGVAGVAPKAVILPIRGLGLQGFIRTETQIEAIGYAAARKADVINMSFGGMLPSQAVAEQVFSVLDSNPKLVMVASAGNENVDGVSFPAALPGVLSVGATNLEGERSPYSSFGQRLDVVAPGGDTSKMSTRGILTTGGTWVEDFWRGITKLPTTNNWAWGTTFDPQGKYVEVQGTSFSAPIVSGVVALMKSEDPGRKLSRDRIVEMIKKTSSYQGLQITKSDEYRYRLRVATGIGGSPTVPIRVSGIVQPVRPVTVQQYYFGNGLVNAEAAVEAVKRVR